MDGEGENIYRVCRKRAEKAKGKEHFGSTEKAANTLRTELEAQPGRKGREECHVSYGSVKEYESGKAVPTPETVGFMAEVYGTPELKWLHCSKECPLGRDTTHIDDAIGSEDVYHTYFDLVGAFDKIAGVEESLHKVIEDERLGEDEGAAVDGILKVLDDIAESTNELRVWVEKQRAAASEGA